MNYVVLILFVVLVIIIIVVCIILYVNYKKKIKDLDINILNSVYGSDGYYMHYVSLIDIFKSLVNIANYDQNYIQIEDDNQYKLIVIYKGNLNYITCTITDENNNILSESDFEMQFIDINEFYGQEMVKNINTNLLNIGYYKNILLNINDSSTEVKNKSWVGIKNIETKNEIVFKYLDGELIKIK